ncbi:hypothetical protein ES703_50631 [subsurface metagenome]
MANLKTGLQLLAITAVAIGITYEVMTKAPLGYLLITGGALVFAISTKIGRG